MKPDTDEPDHDAYTERMLDRADYLRTERKDREWEQSQRPQDGRICDHEDANKYRVIAGELIAAIRVNVLRGTFATATIEQVDEWLKPWIDRMR